MKKNNESIRDVNNSFHSEALCYLESQQAELKPQLRQQAEVDASLVYAAIEEVTRVELLEQFLHVRYQGQKRFSIEGSESLIPLLTNLINKLPSETKTVVIAMSHRGRLSVLHHVVHKPIEQIFLEFEGFELDPDVRSGDVKYHKGFRNKVNDRDLIVLDNPSHLESVYPVALGYCRGLLDESKNPKSAIPIILHGDAAISGQGVVYETMQMHALDAYKVGGAIHIIINNNIGFTADPHQYRSTQHPSDIAKAFDFPVIQVNADDVHGVLVAAIRAMEIRQESGTDVIIELIGYRRWGHNEGDDPTFTQPLQYHEIWVKKSFHEQVLEKFLLEKFLVEQLPAEHHEVARHSLKEQTNSYQSYLTTTHAEVVKRKTSLTTQHQGSHHQGPLQSLRHHTMLLAPIDTSVTIERLVHVAEVLTHVEEKNSTHETIKRQMRMRGEQLHRELQNWKVDWGLAELFAFATICLDGVAVRLVGQDSERGTFSQRHAVLLDQRDGRKFIPLQNLLDDPSLFYIQNSLLSEAAAIGFEYGYSLSRKECLTIWEAQFGDFVNGAQVYLDQYLSCAEEKWGKSSNIVLLLPHGYEGQGPEHSSARLERFLQLAAQDNWIIASPSTPAQYFHLMRRQVASGFPRKPLIILTPKSLLRLPQCTSPLADFAHNSIRGSFQYIIDDGRVDLPVVLLCTGKMFYSLEGYEASRIRIEQLYPFPKAALEEALSKRKRGVVIVWVQEEPENMGAALYMKEQLAEWEALYLCRGESATTATGLHSIHETEEQILIESLKQILLQANGQNEC